MSPKSAFFITITLLILFHSVLAHNMKCIITKDEQGFQTDTCPDLYTCVNTQCVHKDIFPLTSREIIGSVIIMLIGGMHSSGGLGGGSKMSPILLTFFEYDTTKTISIVYILIFGGALGNFLNVFRRRERQTKRPLIIYDLALLVMPAMIIGTYLGVIGNQILAPIITLVGVTLVMINTLRKIYTKAKVAYAKESRKRNTPLLDQHIKSDIESDSQPTEIDTSSSNLNQSALEDRLDLLEEEDYKLLPKRKAGLLLGLLLFTTIMTYLRGTEMLPSVIGIEQCSPFYWGFFMLSLLGCFLFFLGNRKFVSKRLALKKERGSLLEEQSYHLNEEKDIRKLCIYGTVAGFLGGLLGIGGGIILGPTILKLGVEAQSQAATVGFFVLQTSFIALFQTFLYGNVSNNELIFFFLISVVGSYLFSVTMTWIVKKFDRPSILLFLQLGVIVISVIGMPIFTVWKTIDRPEEMLTFSTVC